MSEHYAVIGSGFGDEGKGKTVEHLCSQLDPDKTIVARFNGGPQAGHNVYNGQTVHEFSNFGAGSLLGIPTYWSKYCTVDPRALLKEHSVLKSKGITPTLFIDRKSPIITPYDKYKNTRDLFNREHGTCGAGVGTTFQREEDFHSILWEDILFPEILKIKIDLLKGYYGDVGLEDLLNIFYDSINKIKLMPNITMVNNSHDILTGKNVVFEGAQGLLLDQNIGFFPHVTRSNTGSKNILEMGYLPKIFLPLRAYTTRHGNGPLSNENYINENPKFVRNIFESNHTNRYQGEFRVAPLDLDMLSYAFMKDHYISSSKINLVVNHLDCVDEYVLYHERILHEFPTMNSFLVYIKTVLKGTKLYMSDGPSSNSIIEFN